MTMPLAILVLVLLMGVGTAWLLLRRSHVPHLVSDSRRFDARATSLDRYQVMSRLLAGEDTDFLRRMNLLDQENRGWFLSRRRRIMRMYLRELRRDFYDMWSVCRLLAPYVEDPDFGAVLMKQLFAFYGAYALLWLRLSTNLTSEIRLDVDALVGSLRTLREGARHAVRTTERLAYQTDSTAG